MSEENKESPEIKKKQPFNDLLMKPFSLGWTREVVKRVVTHNKTPNCDIYYFSPNKKKLRSLQEVKSHLTDGLSPECFSFKREPLGLSPDLETVRDAKTRGKVAEKFKEKVKVSVELKNTLKSENVEKDADDEKNNEKEAEMETPEIDNSKPNIEVKGEEPVANASKEKVQIKKNSGKDFESKSKRAKPNDKENNENNKGINNKKKAKTKGRPPKSTKSVKVESVKKRKTILKRMLSAKKAKQAKAVPSKKIMKQIIKKKKVVSPKQKLSNTQKTKKAGLKSNKSKTLKIKTEKKPLKNSLTKMKNEVTKEPETNHAEKSAARDLKSIVKKNIGKYREMREKQKLGAGKSQVRGITKKLVVATVRRSRLEPISKNKLLYLKPLQKGWRRELVFRTNCARAGQQADVYYFHPSGKKLRSCREVAENLTHGFSIEYFTFRKEPIGCGEPFEIIRNARSHPKN